MELKIYKFAELSNCTLTTPAQVFGRNGAGKTSIYNAYLWALTGKGKDGSDMNDAVYSTSDDEYERYADVEVKFDEHTFHRICKPIYARHSKTKEKQLKTLCATTYILDGVETTMTLYNKSVSEMCKNQPFQMFSDIDWFLRQNKNKQIEIFMQIVGIDKNDFVGKMRDIALINKELSQTRAEIKEEEKFNDARRRELDEVVLPADFGEKIKEKTAEIERIQEQRPTLTAEQIAENNEILKQIESLQNYAYKTISTEKQRILGEKRANFNQELDNRNNVVRAKIEQERLLSDVKKRLEKWNENCEMPTNSPEIEQIKAKIVQYEQKKDADETLLNNYEEANKDASCGLCPHCTDIFCEHRKTDLPSEDDLIRNITQYTNDIAGFWAKIHEIENDWTRQRGKEYAEITERIRDLESNMPNVADADERLNKAKEAVILAEKEYDEETARNEAIAHENEQKRAENERKIAELKSKMHIAQTQTIDNKLWSLKAELSDLNKRQAEFDEKMSVRKHLNDVIVKMCEKIDQLTDKAIALENEKYEYERADEDFRNAVQTKANEILPDGMTIKLFRPLISGDGYETTFELTYANKKFKNTALQIWGNFELTKVLQQSFGVSLPIFVDDMANITDDEFLPYGENVVHLVAVRGLELCIEKMNYNL